ncbi:MAG: efflux RND transporter periplasmic adaptor subunit [Candidatus Pacebacteria bacterium]|nr:efflux RND transporter periplasmic adaptor subunit [Candidatus Paceibacterota bacterium]
MTTKRFFKKRKKLLISFIILIASIAVISFFILGKEKESIYSFVVAEKGNLIQEISATGRVNAVNDIDLAFEKSGRVSKVNIEIGDVFKKGQILIELESNEILAELSQARASVESAKATLQQYEAVLEGEKITLEELKKGTRPEEILVYESKVDNAKATLEAAKENIVDNLLDSYTRSDNAIRNMVDPMFSNPQGSNPEISFPISSSQLEIDVNWKRAFIEEMLFEWTNSLEQVDTFSDLTSNVEESEEYLNEIKTFLQEMAIAVNGLSASIDFSETTIEGYRTDVYTARTDINTAITNLSSAKEELNTADTALSVAINELSLKESGSTSEQINNQEAIIRQAMANINSQKAEIKLKESSVSASRAKLYKNYLRSPIDGIITKQDAKIGEIVPANEIIVSIISQGEFEIEADIVEADIANLKIGDKAKLSLDAYGEDIIFKANVIKIDPAAVLIEGVANYKTTLVFEEKDDRIRAGMTADLDIITAQKDNIIVIPQRAVIYKNGAGKFVRILMEEDIIEETQIETGISGNGGKIEILKGVREGDKVITSIKK